MHLGKISDLCPRIHPASTLFVAGMCYRTRLIVGITIKLLASLCLAEGCFPFFGGKCRWLASLRLLHGDSNGKVCQCILRLRMSSVGKAEPSVVSSFKKIVPSLL